MRQAKGILFVDSDCYLAGDIDEYLARISVNLTSDAPLLVGLEPGMDHTVGHGRGPGWIRYLHAERVYDPDKTLNSGTVLFRPSSTKVKEALWRLWAESPYRPSPLEAWESELTAVFTVPRQPNIRNACNSTRLWWAVLVEALNQTSRAFASSLRSFQSVPDAMTIEITHPGIVTLRLKRIADYETLDALSAMLRKMKHCATRGSKACSAAWRAEPSRRSACKIVRLREVSESLRYYQRLRVWPGEQDRMQDLAQRDPTLIEIVKLQYRPSFDESSKLLLRDECHEPCLVVLPKNKKSTAAAAMQRMTQGASFFGTGNASLHELWLSINVSSVKDLECCLARVGVRSKALGIAAQCEPLAGADPLLSFDSTPWRPSSIPHASKWSSPEEKCKRSPQCLRPCVRGVRACSECVSACIPSIPIIPTPSPTYWPSFP